MNTLALLNDFRDRITSSDSRKLHCAVFLAQSFTHSTYYSFSLMRGRVFSEDLDQDFIVVMTGRVNASGTFFSKSRPFHRVQELLTAQLTWLLDQDAEVVEAAATQWFYDNEGLGDPSEKLRWYKALSPSVRSAASKLQPPRGA
jgi:hypothetical protein